MDIGFTGTQLGMTPEQSFQFMGLIFQIAKNLTAHGETGVFHHGDCIGADAMAHARVRLIGWTVILHPPIKTYKRAFCQADVTRPATDYLVRNLEIVKESDLLIATPAEFEEQLRSGTWSTIRRARKLGKPHVIIFPDGTLQVHGYD